MCCALSTRIVPGRCSGLRTCCFRNRTRIGWWFLFDHDCFRFALAENRVEMRAGHLFDLGAVFLPDMVGGWDDRNDQNHNDDGQQIRIDAWNGVTKEESQQGQTGAPQQAAEHIVRGKMPIGHSRDTGNDWHERAREWNEPRQYDGATAVPFEELFGQHEILRFEEAGFWFLEESTSVMLADFISGGIASDRRHDTHGNQNPDIEKILRCQKPGGEEQTVTGQKEPDEQTCFRKDDDENTNVTNSLDEMIEIAWKHLETLQNTDACRKNRGECHGNLPSIEHRSVSDYLVL